MEPVAVTAAASVTSAVTVIELVEDPDPLAAAASVLA